MRGIQCHTFIQIWNEEQKSILIFLNGNREAVSTLKGFFLLIYGLWNVVDICHEFFWNVNENKRMGEKERVQGEQCKQAANLFNYSDVLELFTN